MGCLYATSIKLSIEIVQIYKFRKIEKAKLPWLTTRNKPISGDIISYFLINLYFCTIQT